MISETRVLRTSVLDRFTILATALAGTRRKRLTMCELTALNDHLLRDVGLTRADLFDAQTVPPSSDSYEVLRLARMRNLR